MSELDDNSLFPFGVHFRNRVKMKDVPVDYFDWMLAQPWAGKWPAVQEYARRVRAALAKEWADKEDVTDIGFDRAPLPTYKPRVDIREKLKQISEATSLMIRHFEKTREQHATLICPRCGQRSLGMHLSTNRCGNARGRYNVTGRCETSDCLQWMT